MTSGGLRGVGVGLGLLVGAVLHVRVEAQVKPVPRDSAVADSARRSDSLRVPLPASEGADTAAQRGDSVKAPLTRAEIPPLVADRGRFRWDQPALFATGALGLVDLLRSVPGVTAFRSGWIASPSQAVYLGDGGRVRIFLDGVELDALDPRTAFALNARGDSAMLLDLNEVPLYTMDDVAIERGAGEVRVYLRSWQVTRTTPYTRTDIATGAENTNLYRGFFGRRFGSGAAVQVAAQQFGTTGGSTFGGGTLGGGDELSLTGRLGWAKGAWSIDAFAVRASRSRDAQNQGLGGSTIPPLESTRTSAYIRAGYGRPEDGPWAQLIASSMSFKEQTEPSPPVPGDTTPRPSPDTARSRAQYVTVAGMTLSGVRLSATNRLRVFEHRRENVLSGRLAVEIDAIGISLYAEQQGATRPAIEEATVRLSPFGVLALSGSATRRHGGPVAVERTARLDLRGEGAVRLGGVWMAGGLLRRDSAQVAALRVYAAAYDVRVEGPTTGTLATIRGQLWRDLHVDAQMLRWSSSGAYRPQIEAYADVFVRSRWLHRFPSGNFGVLASTRYDYRSQTRFPTSAGVHELTTFAQALGLRLEIQIVDAVLFYQQQLTLRRQTFDVVPGYFLPRQSVLYGVRWEFWN